MLQQGGRPDGITFSALITAYQRGNQWREALQAFSHMPSSSCHPDSVVYNALLEVCWSSGVLHMQMRATQIWSLANRSGHFRCVCVLTQAGWCCVMMCCWKYRLWGHDTCTPTPLA
jgi:pentatricopeptide repeat domain-containing protein 1